MFVPCRAIQAAAKICSGQALTPQEVVWVTDKLQPCFTFESETLQYSTAYGTSGTTVKCDFFIFIFFSYNGFINRIVFSAYSMSSHLVCSKDTQKWTQHAAEVGMGHRKIAANRL